MDQFPLYSCTKFSDKMQLREGRKIYFSWPFQISFYFWEKSRQELEADLFAIPDRAWFTVKKQIMVDAACELVCRQTYNQLAFLDSSEPPASAWYPTHSGLSHSASIAIKTIPYRHVQIIPPLRLSSQGNLDHVRLTSKANRNSYLSCGSRIWNAQEHSMVQLWSPAQCWFFFFLLYHHKAGSIIREYRTSMPVLLL